jgi:Protein of unknown function (DUF1579)
MAHPIDAETERLGVLTGIWRTEGWTRGAPGEPEERIEAVDTYEWLPGGAGLLHVVDARVGGERVEGAEIIGYDPDRGAFTSLYFGTDGPTAYEARLGEQEGALAWTMRSPDIRFEGTFSADGNTITGQWEALDTDGSWKPSMDITLTKRPSAGTD